MPPRSAVGNTITKGRQTFFSNILRRSLRRCINAARARRQSGSSPCRHSSTHNGPEPGRAVKIASVIPPSASGDSAISTRSLRVRKCKLSSKRLRKISTAAGWSANKNTKLKPLAHSRCGRSSRQIRSSAGLSVITGFHFVPQQRMHIVPSLAVAVIQQIFTLLQTGEIRQFMQARQLWLMA